MSNKLSVIGCGRWGSCLAWYTDRIGEDVILYGRKGASDFAALKETRKNEFVTLPASVALTDDLAEALASDTLIISIGSQNLRAFLAECAPFDLTGKTIVLCMKGLEIESGMRLSSIVREVLGERVRVAVWVGPGHIQDFVLGIPNCMVIDSDDEETKTELAHRFASDLIRFYVGQDLVGNEIGAAAKNVYGIGAGILDGLGYASLKGAFIVRSAVEMARFITACGGDAKSIYGLAFLGECETTFFSPHSNNKRFGEKFVRGEAETRLCEGVYSLEVLHRQSREKGVEMPICDALYRCVIARETDAKTLLATLFSRSLKEEF
ncbi:MAG: glycerol-3-phosphate dehydrogenase [Clostridia bacterium]|nr:glycerol-3-phosphate dehydrogenase [Clostridia bacterium]